MHWKSIISTVGITLACVWFVLDSNYPDTAVEIREDVATWFSPDESSAGTSSFFGASFGNSTAAARGPSPSQTERLVEYAVAKVVPISRREFAEVEMVTDGDTLWTTSGEEIRFYGVDTEEHGYACYDGATRRTQELVAGGIYMEKSNTGRLVDDHGRSLRYIYTATGASVEAVLVAEGWGRAWVRDGQHADDLEFIAAQAASLGVGCIYQ